MSATIEDLPDELLEHILDIVSPYKDLDNCKLVSKKWHHALKRVIQRKQISLINAIKASNLKWEYGNCDALSMRYLHSACYQDGKMYVFGGFSKNHVTCFNDLFELDLCTRKWTRLLGVGSSPQPKAGATMCAYKDMLIIFGGCTRVSDFQPLVMFPEIHTFDLNRKIWTQVECTFTPLPSLSCHSATIHGDEMIVYGGFTNHLDRVSKITYCFDLITWRITIVDAEGPPPIYGASQVYIDSHHFLVTGGWQREGPEQIANMSTWLLSMKTLPWHWNNVTDENVNWTPPKRKFSSPVVSKIGDFVIAFSYIDDEVKNGINSVIFNGMKRDELQRNIIDGAVNVEEARQFYNPVPIYRMGLGERRQRQMQVLHRYAKMYTVAAHQKKSLNMAVYFGYIGDLLESNKIVWKEPRCTKGLHHTRTLYTQIVARSEIIIFGGLAWSGAEKYRDMCLVQDNPLAFIKAPFSIL